MHGALIRHWRSLVVSLAVLAGSSTVALAAGSPYCDPLNGCKSYYLKATPSKVKAGTATTLHGSVGHRCKTPARVTIYSAAFKGATTHRFAGAPALYVRASKNHKFSKKVTIKRAVKAGSYRVTGSCGGKKIGSLKLKIT